jgi:predicted nucleic acid-binding protein
VADGYVIDTDVISYLFRGDSRAEPYRPYLVGTTLAVSFMTVAELDRWAIQRNWGAARQDRLAHFLEQFAIVLVDRALCRMWAEVGESARSHGRPIQTADAWIAATAISLGVPLLTYNHEDYVGVSDLVVLPERAM